MEDYNFKLYSKLGRDFWYVKSRQDLLKGILGKAFRKKNLKILDAGCGTGFNFEALHEFGDVYGVDLNKNAIAQCKNLGYKKLEQKDAAKLGYKNFFDAVVAVELIEHIDDDFSAVQKLCQYLKPDSLLVLTVPAHKFLWSADDVLAMHKRRYSKQRLRKLVQKSGFRIKYLGYRYFFLFLPAIAVFIMQKFGKKKKNSLESTPKFLNKVLLKLMSAENKLILKGFRLLFGAGLICIARKN